MALVPVAQVERDEPLKSMTILNSVFFDRPEVAHDLIGCGLNWNCGEESVSRPITETEAYVGPHDLASHAATDAEPNVPQSCLASRELCISISSMECIGC